MAMSILEVVYHLKARTLSSLPMCKIWRL